MTSTHSIYKEFDNQMKTLISTYANNNPAPMWGTIANISPDEEFVDVTIGDGTLKAVRRFGGQPELNSKCILIFMGGSYENPVALCNSYTAKDPSFNLVNNGRFQKRNSSGFEDWTGGTVSTLNYWYDKSTARILPKQQMTTANINISQLRDKEKGDLSEVMLFYFYIGQLEIEIIDKKTETPITFAPENLEIKKEILEPVNTWHYARSYFLLRDHENITIKFINASSKESVYIDGIRLWSPDFEEWYPSVKDKGDD